MVRAAAVTPLPQAPEVVLGIVDFRGEVIPVVNLRKRFRLPEKALSSEHHFVIAESARFTLALVVDAADQVIAEAQSDMVAAEQIVAGMEFVRGVTRTDQGLLLIHDLETLLFPAEELLLAQALERAQ